jgi:hypothetical protein
LIGLADHRLEDRPQDEDVLRQPEAPVQETDEQKTISLVTFV